MHTINAVFIDKTYLQPFSQKINIIWSPSCHSKIVWLSTAWKTSFFSYSESKHFPSNILFEWRLVFLYTKRSYGFRRQKYIISSMDYFYYACMVHFLSFLTLLVPIHFHCIKESTSDTHVCLSFFGIGFFKCVQMGSKTISAEKPIQMSESSYIGMVREAYFTCEWFWNPICLAM